MELVSASPETGRLGEEWVVSRTEGVGVTDGGGGDTVTESVLSLTDGGGLSQ